MRTSKYDVKSNRIVKIVCANKRNGSIMKLMRCKNNKLRLQLKNEGANEPDRRWACNYAFKIKIWNASDVLGMAWLAPEIRGSLGQSRVVKLTQLLRQFLRAHFWSWKPRLIWNRSRRKLICCSPNEVIIQNGARLFDRQTYLPNTILPDMC